MPMMVPVSGFDISIAVQRRPCDEPKNAQEILFPYNDSKISNMNYIYHNFYNYKLYT